MAHAHVKAYTKAALDLTRSIYLYSSTVGKQTLHWYRITHPFTFMECVGENDHPYHRHLRGEDVPGIDTPITFMSVEVTPSLVTLSNTLEYTHPKTWEHLRNNLDYRHSVVDANGDMAMQRVMGILFPMYMDESVRDGTIIYYDKQLVESHEYSLMDDLQEWIYITLHRWTNSGYIATDRLYASALMAILYAYMPAQIMYQRDKRVMTQEVHSFHINRYLSDHGFSDVVDHIPPQQLYPLYRNIAYLLSIRGSNKAYDMLYEMLFNNTALTVRTFETVPLYSAENDALGIQEHVSPTGSTQLTPITTYGEYIGIDDSFDDIANLKKDIYEGRHLDTTALIMVDNYQTLPLVRPNLYNTLITMWGWASLTGRYEGSITITLSNTVNRKLSMRDAFIYYWLLTQGTEEIILTWIPQDSVINDCSEAHIYITPLPYNLSDSTFTQTVEDMYSKREQNALFLTGMSTATIFEQVCNNQVFSRCYSNYSEVIPNKVTWLQLNVLPDKSADKSFIDALVEQCIHFTTSRHYLQNMRRDITALALMNNVSHVSQVTTRHSAQPYMLPLLTSTIGV